MKRSFEVWFRAAGIVLVATALVSFLTGFYSRKFHLETGNAKWIWIEHQLDKRQPIAFFATRDIDVPPSPPFVRLRLACDADWTLYLNGTEIAGGESSPDPRLLVFDLTDLARKGERNRFVVALRSSTGVGGLLASIDYAPLRENDVVTNESWQLCRTWSPGIITGETQCGEQAVALGKPPFGRWNYPVTGPGAFYESQEGELAHAVNEVGAQLVRREIRVIDGLAVESSSSLPARRFDFGPVEGRVRLILNQPAGEVSLVEARYAADAAALEKSGDSRMFVFAPGESVVTDPVPRGFRFMAVASSNATVDVIRERVSAGSVR